jgi:hypothetical protein
VIGHRTRIAIGLVCASLACVFALPSNGFASAGDARLWTSFLSLGLVPMLYLARAMRPARGLSISACRGLVLLERLRLMPRTWRRTGAYPIKKRI